MAQAATGAPHCPLQVRGRASCPEPTPLDDSPVPPMLSAVFRHQHGFRWQSRPRASSWPLVVTGATNINTDHGCSSVMDPAMAAWAQTTYGLRWLCRPLTSACSSLPSCLRFRLSPQHMNSSRSLSRPFLYTYLLIVVAPGDPCDTAAGGPRAGLPLTRAPVRTCLCLFTYITKTLSV